MSLFHYFRRSVWRRLKMTTTPFTFTWHWAFFRAKFIFFVHIKLNISVFYTQVSNSNPIAQSCNNRKKKINKRCKLLRLLLRNWKLESVFIAQLSFNNDDDNNNNSNEKKSSEVYKNYTKVNSSQKVWRSLYKNSRSWISYTAFIELVINKSLNCNANRSSEVSVNTFPMFK